jgi:3-hydroxyisobutyrate dehydrogenase-like beta-hydroxyacid dehydrogenase
MAILESAFITIADKRSPRNGQIMSNASESRKCQEPKVGLIGLGLVGSAMAQRLRAAGFKVIGFDISAEAAARFADSGGTLAENEAEVAAQCRTILLSLPDGDIMSVVIDRISKSIHPASLIIDTTTAAPDQVLHAYESLKTVEAGYLDATLSGSSEVIAAGLATWFVGGSELDFQIASPVFDAIGGKVHHLGPVGAGTQAKLVSNLILGLNRAALAEGLALAESWGMSMHATLDALKSSAAYSKVMDAKGLKMIDADYRPQARLKQHHKDVRLILESAETLGSNLPISKLHDVILNQAEAAGWGEADNAAVIEVWRGRSNPDSIKTDD